MTLKFLLISVALAWTIVHPFYFSLATALDSGREVVSFDFAWRFHLGDVSGNVSCPPSSFPTNLSGVECQGLQKNDAMTADDCRGACCDNPSCAIWQFEASCNTSACGCWMGQSSDCNNPNKNWVGGGRSSPGPVPHGPT